MHPQISLEQWRCLLAVVDAGGYAQAAAVLHKSQSAVTYAVQKIEQQLAVKAFEIIGRKAVLTETGRMLYRRALALVKEANEIEMAAHRLSAGWESEIRIAAEILFPLELLFVCLQQFAEESPHTRIEVIESVMGGTSDALMRGEADLVISPIVPTGYLGELLMRVKLMVVAHADHALHQLGREIGSRDLREHRHIVVRDSGNNRDKCPMTVDVEQRWTVSHISSSIQGVLQGHGFAWLPVLHIAKELQAGILKPLPLKNEGIREVALYLMLANPDLAGPGVKRMAGLIKTLVGQQEI